MLYNRKQVLEAIKIVEAFETTVKTKKGHEPKLYELQQLINNTLTPIHSDLFEDFNWYYPDYKQAVKLGTKSDMDKYLRLVKIDYLRQLQSILEIEE